MKESDHEEVPVKDFLFMNTSSFLSWELQEKQDPSLVIRVIEQILE